MVVVHLNESVSVCALAIALGLAATPAMAQQTGNTPPNPSTPTDVSQAKIAAAQAGVAGAGDATDDQKDAAADIVVTGTHISRPNIGSPSPILTITSEEIKQSGAISISDVLNRLPQVAVDNQATYQDSNGAQQVQLRGLGFNRTLSLIDGQRISTSEGVNVNSIPVALVDRIDVLTGGAASVYGADAVAGVINFVLKKDFTGLQIGGNFSMLTHNNDGNNVGARTAAAQGLPVVHGLSADGGTANINAAWGGHFFGDRLKVEAYAGYIHTDPILNSDRDYSSCYLTQSNGTNTAPVCQLSTTSTPYGVFRPGTGANAGVAYADARDSSRTFVPRDASFTYEPYGQTYFQRAFERYNGGAFLDFEATSHLHLYATYMLSYDKSHNQFRPTFLLNAPDYGFANSYTINCNNPLLSGQQQGVLCGASAGTATQVPIGLRYQFAALPSPVETFNNVDQRATGGIRGDFLDDAIKYDVGFVYSSARTDDVGSPEFGTPSYANIQNALNVVNVNGVPTCASGAAGCVPLDIFKANSGSQAQLDYIFGTVSGKATKTSYLFDYTANITTDLGKFGVRSPFADDGVAFAIGAEYRVDKQTNRVDDAGLDQVGGGSFHLSQNVGEAYAELSLPVAQHKPFADLLSFTASFRGSKYSLGPKIFTTWQLGGIYAPVPDLTFRASYNKASRQPTVYEFGSNVPTFVGGSGDPCATTPAVPAVPATPGNPGSPGTPAIPPTATAAQCANTGVTAAEYGHVPQCDNNSCLARSGGVHPDPETAHTLTYGLMLKPRFIPRLVLSVDRYDITVDDQINYSYDSDYMNSCLAFGIPIFCSHVVRNPDGSLTSADLYRPGTTPTTGFTTYGIANQYKYIAKGYDFQGQYSLPIERVGNLDFIFNGTLAEVRGGQDGPTYPVRNGVGFFGPFAGIPRPKWSQTLRTTYTTPNKDASISLNWRYIGGTSTTVNSGQPELNSLPNTVRLTSFNTIPAYNYIDLSVNFNVGKRFTFGLLANNLFDLLPPVQPDSYTQNLTRSNTIPVYDILGRFIQVNFSAKF